MISASTVSVLALVIAASTSDSIASMEAVESETREFFDLVRRCAPAATEIAVCDEQSLYTPTVRRVVMLHGPVTEDERAAVEDHLSLRAPWIRWRVRLAG